MEKSLLTKFGFLVWSRIHQLYLSWRETSFTPASENNPAIYKLEHKLFMQLFTYKLTFIYSSVERELNSGYNNKK